MSLSGQSLNAATITGAGTSILFDVPHSSHSLIVEVTGSPDACTVHLEGTIDGVNWFGVAQVTISSLITNVGNFPVMGTRANLVSLSGGSSPTVSAWIAAA